MPAQPTRLTTGEPMELYQLARSWRILFGGQDPRAWYVVGPDNQPIWLTKDYASQKGV